MFFIFEFIGKGIIQSLEEAQALNQRRKQCTLYYRNS